MKLLLLSVLTFFPFQAFCAGGIVRNGETLTIGSSGLSVELKALGPADLPELELLPPVLRQLTLPIEVQGSLSRQMRPSLQRKFFRVPRISLEAEKALVEEYRKIFPELPNNDRFTLLALTDREKGETYLLPAYEQLGTRPQKAAVLFQEGVLASGLISGLENLEALAALLEAVLSCRADCGFALDDLQVRLTTSLAYQSAVQIFMMMLQKSAVQDAKAGLLKGILAPNGDLNLVALLGPDLTRMMLADFSGEIGSMVSSLSGNYREVRLGELQEQWPKSRFLRILLNCPYELLLVRHAFADQYYELEDSRVSVIGGWKYEELQIRFSQKTITYGPEISDYYFTHRSRGGEDFLALASHQGTEGARLVVQAIDSNRTAAKRKAYLVKSTRGRNWDSDESRFSYYFFGLSLK